MVKDRNAEFSTIEDSRYTMEQAEKNGLINPPRGWQKMNHTELCEFFKEYGIKMRKKPKRLRSTF